MKAINLVDNKNRYRLEWIIIKESREQTKNHKNLFVKRYMEDQDGINNQNK